MYVSAKGLRRGFARAGNVEKGSFSFPSPTSHEHQFYGLTSGFTRLIMTTKYVCHGLIYLHANFQDNRTM